MNVAERSVVVTGAGSGIGAALATEAAARGASAVAVVDIDLASAQASATRISEQTGVTTTAHECDVSDSEAVAAMAAEIIEAHGVPGLVCANAGVGPSGSRLLHADLTETSWVFGVNVFGLLTTLQAFGRVMVESEQSGWLMATGSEHSLGVPHTGMGTYTASKHAVLGLCDVLRAELPDHVGLSVLCPGLTTSDFWQAGRRRPASFGGPVEPKNDAGAALMAKGLDPDELAKRAFDGVEGERFIIATHANAQVYAEVRAADVVAGFDALEASGVPLDSYDVGEVIAQLRSEG